MRSSSVSDSAIRRHRKRIRGSVRWGFSAVCFGRALPLVPATAALASLVFLAASFYGERLIPIHVSANKRSTSIMPFIQPGIRCRWYRSRNFHRKVTSSQPDYVHRMPAPL